MQRSDLTCLMQSFDTYKLHEVEAGDQREKNRFSVWVTVSSIVVEFNGVAGRHSFPEFPMAGSIFPITMQVTELDRATCLEAIRISE